MIDLRRNLPSWIRAVLATLILIGIGGIVIGRVVPTGTTGHDTAVMLLCGLAGGTASRIWLGGARSCRSGG
ncbi:MAG TPA: hypothetical protein VLI40_12345 [Gemmatimonadaceae bacterium]|nr:hypothetical protein [Gemmatimonadaceae bacterium]